MPVVRITLWSGRPQEVKDRLASEITDAVEKVLGSRREQTIVIFEDVPKADYYIAGNPSAKA